MFTALTRLAQQNLTVKVHEKVLRPVGKNLVLSIIRFGKYSGHLMSVLYAIVYYTYILCTHIDINRVDTEP